MLRKHFVFPACVLILIGPLRTSPFVTADVTVGGNRPVVVKVPASYDPEIPAPLIVEFHPYGPFTGNNSWWGLQSLARDEGVLFAAPTGSTNNVSYQYWDATDACCANIGGGTPVDDSGYIREFIEEITEALNVARDRIYVAGFSNGGFMAHRMACDHADLIAAAVSQGGSTWNDPGRCTPVAPVHLLEIRGTIDSQARFDGGTIGGTPYPGAVETVERWALHNGCTLETDIGPSIDLDPSLPGDETTVTRYTSNCDTGGSVELWVVGGGEHLSASGAVAGRHIFDYLLAHPKRPAPVASFTATPAEGLGPLEVAFDASASSTPEGTEITRYLWDFGDGEKAEGVRAAHAYGQPGRYVVSLRVLTADDRVSVRARRAVQVHCDTSDVAPWHAGDIGDPVFPGGAALESSGESLVVCAGGEGLTGSADQFFFVFKAVTGDFRLSAHIRGMSGGAPGAGVGLMVRESEEEGAAFGASLLETQVNGARFRLRYRADRGVAARSTSGERSPESAGWLRIERRSRTVTAFASVDGETWAQIDERDVALPDTVLIGVAVFGRDGGTTDTPFQPLRSEISATELSSLGVSFLRGDCTNDGTVDIADATCALNWLFAGGAGPGCRAALNSSADDEVDIADPVFLLHFLFSGGSIIADPFPECGPGMLPADAELGCASPPDCQ